MNLKKHLAALLAAVTCLSLLAACNSETDTESESASESSTVVTTEAETGSEEESAPRFDYFNADMTEYVSLDSYKGLTVTLDDSYEIDDASVAEYIDYLCEYYATGVKVTDRAVKEGDTVYLYYEGFYLDGTAFEGGSNMTSTSPHALEIGSGSFIPGFEEGLIGLIPAETSKENRYDLHLTFPENYHNAEMAGVEVIFKVYIEYIEEYQKSEYTDAFITDVLKFTTEEPDLKAAFEVYIKELLETQSENAVKDAAWNTVLEALQVIKYPAGEVEYYYNSYLEQYESYMEFYSYYGYRFESLDDFVWQYLGLPEGTDWEAITSENSRMGVKQNLAFHYIAQVEGMVITDADYRKSVEYYVSYYASQGANYTAEQIEQIVGSDMIKSQALFDKVTELLVANTTVEYAPLAEEEN